MISGGRKTSYFELGSPLGAHHGSYGTPSGFTVLLDCDEHDASNLWNHAALISMWEICIKSNLLFIQISHIEIRCTLVPCMVLVSSAQVRTAKKPTCVAWHHLGTTCVSSDLEKLVFRLYKITKWDTVISISFIKTFRWKCGAFWQFQSTHIIRV